MQTIIQDKDVRVLYVTATSFPEGITEAFEKLHQRIPPTPARTVYGISRPENGGGIVYRAAVEELNENDAQTFQCETLVLPKGKYISETVENIQQDVMAIDRAFKHLLQQPDLDPQGYCVEKYTPAGDKALCMIRLSI